MRRFIGGFLLAGVLASAALGARPMAWGPELDKEAPPLDPKLLAVVRFGAGGDQCFTAVQAGADGAVGAGGGLRAFVVVRPDDTVQVKYGGNLAAGGGDLGAGISAFKSKTLGKFTYGYKQVHAILQQPYINGPGWKWWDWTYDQCKPRERMADSRCTFLANMPNGHLIAFGKCDGGNTSLRVDPRNLDEKLPFKILHGGGGGTSSFVFEIDPAGGEPVRQLILRGFANNVCWDYWGRVMVVGRGIIPKAKNDFGYGDGAGIMMADREWTQTLFSTHVGTEGGGGASFWACDINSSSGIAAVGGFVEGDVKQVGGLQTRPGGGKDALLAVFRLWKPVTKEPDKGAPVPEPRKPAPRISY